MCRVMDCRGSEEGKGRIMHVSGGGEKGVE